MVNVCTGYVYIIVIIRCLLTGCPPAITTQPTSQLTTVNLNVTLTCEATGILPITYHWEVKTINGEEWMNISNSNNTKLVRNLQQSEQYRCVASNQFNSTKSNIATVNVLSKCAAIDF